MSLQLTIDYPENLPDAIGKTREEFEREAKWAMAVKLFELKQLSSGMAAALVGVDRVTFLLKLNDYGVPAIAFYQKLGFYFIDRYNDSPCQVFMDKILY